LYIYLRTFHQRVTDWRVAIQILQAHVHGGDSGIVVGGIIIDALACIAAAGVSSDFILVRCHPDTAPGHRYGGKDVEELAHTLLFSVAANTVGFNKSGLYEPGGR
jgi:hypothetical protein